MIISSHERGLLANSKMGTLSEKELSGGQSEELISLIIFEGIEVKKSLKQLAISKGSSILRFCEIILLITEFFDCFLLRACLMRSHDFFRFPWLIRNLYS